MQPMRPYAPEPEKHYDVCALLFGAAAFIFCLIPALSVAVGIIGLVYCHRAKWQLGSSKRMRIFAIILSCAGIVLCMSLTVYWIYWFLQIMRMIYDVTEMVPPAKFPEDCHAPVQTAFRLEPAISSC